jgi:tripartite-type tricarboxylate transporter receptor subunit TctC
VFAPILLAAGILCSAVEVAQAEAYPERTIRIIAPYTPGSPNDLLARLLAQDLQARLGQPVVVDNRPGGGTTIGTKAAALAAPDGYTLLFSGSSLVIDPALNKRVDYDPLNDFAPVAAVAATSWLLVVSPDLPVTTLGEFVAYSRAYRGRISFGFAQGTASQLVGERFKVLTGADILSVPYKGGAAAVPDFLGGRIHMLLPTPATTLPMIRRGKMRALAVTSRNRLAELPDVPTMAESGLPELTLDFWAGVLAPAGTSPEIVGTLNTIINNSLESAEMKERMRKLGLTARIGSSQDFADFIAAELPRWAEIVRSSGVRDE